MSKSSNSKRQAILLAARHAFITHGYSGSSVETIADAAPVSKPTLYKHFKSKQDLFAAVIENQCAMLLNTLSSAQAEIRDPVAGLKAIASAFIDLAYSEEAIKLYRLIIAEQQNFPELGQLVYRSGPEAVLKQLSLYLSELTAQKILSIQDIETSSCLFFGMLKGDQHFRCLLGLQSGLADDQKAQLIEATVALFLKGHGYPV